MMRKLIAMMMGIVLGISAMAEPVALNLSATGDTAKIEPKLVQYQPAVAEWTEPVEGADDIVHPAIDEAIIITCEYQIKSGANCIDTTKLGIRTQISSASNPTFIIKATLSPATFSSYFGDGADKVLDALKLAGEIKPNDALATIIRAVAVQIITAE